MKTLDPAMEAALESGHVGLFNAVDIDLPTGHLRLCGAVGTYTINGETYTGAGDLGSIDTIKKDGTSSPEGVVMTLAGIDPSLVSDVMLEHYQGRPCSVLVCIIAAGVVYAHIVFSGRLNTMDITMGKTAAIRVEAENRLVDWQRGSQSRWNDASHQRTLAADQKPDKFFQYVEETAGKEIRFDPYV
jgi:hypothetical protein